MLIKCYVMLCYVVLCFLGGGGGHWSFKIVSWGDGRAHKRFFLMSRGPKWYKTAIDQDRLWNTIKQPFHIKQKDQESNPKYQTYNIDNNNNDDFNNNNVFYNTWAFEAGIKGEELLLPRHTVIWMCLWAKETLIWLSQKLELYRFHFHFCKLANNLTGFVNKYTKK